MTRNPARTLEDWLAYIERQHPQSIALGLDRVRDVAARMGLVQPAERSILVGGTNGKGSTVAFLESIARAAGLRVGAYTSPHLLRYNERVRIDGHEVDDLPLVDAFDGLELALRRVGCVEGHVGHAAFGRGALDQHGKKDHGQRDQHGCADEALFQCGFHRGSNGGATVPARIIDPCLSRLLNPVP